MKVEQMVRWQNEPELRTLILSTLSERAGGMFRWVACQVETLRHCLSREDILAELAALRQTLDPLEKTPLNALDEALKTAPAYPPGKQRQAHSAFGGTPTKNLSTLPTDSGYGSAPSRSHIGNETTHVYKPPQAVVEEEHMTEPDQREQQVDLKSTDGLTEFSGASSLTSHSINLCSKFSHDLFSAVSREDLDELAMEQIAEALPELLKSFALKIGLTVAENLSTSVQCEIMYFVRKHRTEITRRFRQHYAQHIDKASRLLTLSEVPEMSPHDIWTKWHTNTPDLINEAPPDTFPAQSLSDGSDDANVNDSTESTSDEDFQKYQKYLAGSAAYRWLLESLQKQILLAPAVPDLRGDIRRQILRSLPQKKQVSRKSPTEAHEAHYCIDWDPRSFAKEQQYETSPAEGICSAVTVTGKAQDAQALTSIQYLCQTWSSTGHHIMRMVQEVLRREPGEQHSTILPDSTELTAWSCGSKFKVKVLGPEPSIAEVGEQLAWLGAALRSSPEGNGVCYCIPSVKVPDGDVSVEKPGMAVSRLEIQFELKDAENEVSNGQCWQNMFRRPVVVCGYPIARRIAAQTGLEMPLNMMANMVRTNHLVRFDSTWYLKGFSSMLALVGRRDDLFIWHHTYDSKGGRVSYFDHKESSTTAVAVSELQNARHVVGWCPDVKIYADVNYNYNAGASGLPRPHATCVLDKLSISGGKLITGGVGINIGVRDSPIHISRDTYRDRMRWVSGQYTILWDVGDERGWLVNGADALLHMVHASLEDDLEWMKRHHQQSDILVKKDDVMSLATSHTSESALSVLMKGKNKQLKIFINEVDDGENEGEPNPGKSNAKITYTRFKDLVERQYSLLEQIMDHQFHIESRSGLDLKRRARKHLEGWDFKDLAVTIKTNPIYPRVKTLNTLACGWVDFAREIKAITIFGRDFGEIIRPTDTTTMCSSWARLPPGKYYLAVCVSDLKDIMQMTGNVYQCSTTMNVCDGIDWHAMSNLFGPCRCGKTTENTAEHSDFAQVLAPSRMVFRKRPKTNNTVELKPTGAIIFGYSSLWRLFWPDMGSPKESDMLTRVAVKFPEEELEFYDSAIGTSSDPATTISSEAQGSTSPDQTEAAPPIRVRAPSLTAPGSDRNQETQETTQLSDLSIPLGQHNPVQTCGQEIDERFDSQSEFLPSEQFNVTKDPEEECIKDRPANEADDRIDCPTSGDATSEALESLAKRLPSHVDRSASETTNEQERNLRSNKPRRNVGRRLRLWSAKVKPFERLRRLIEMCKCLP